MSENADTMLDGSVAFTTEIVTAYVSHNTIGSGDLPALISQVHAALKKLGQVEEPAVAQLMPAVPIKKSVTPDYIVCLEDGKRFKSLKRHLTHFQLTPEGYRAKWGLPSDYPMVAPNYAATRSALAKSAGLGRKPAVVDAPMARKRTSTEDLAK